MPPYLSDVHHLARATRNRDVLPRIGDIALLKAARLDSASHPIGSPPTVSSTRRSPDDDNPPSTPARTYNILLLWQKAASERRVSKRGRPLTRQGLWRRRIIPCDKARGNEVDEAPRQASAPCGPRHAPPHSLRWRSAPDTRRPGPTRIGHTRGSGQRSRWGAAPSKRPCGATVPQMAPTGPRMRIRHT